MDSKEDKIYNDSSEDFTKDLTSTTPSAIDGDSWDWVQSELRKLEEELPSDSQMLEVVDAISVADFWKRRYDEERILWERKLQHKEEEKTQLKEKTQSHEIALKELEWKLKELERRWQEERLLLEDRLKSKELEAEVKKLQLQWETRLKVLEEENKKLKARLSPDEAAAISAGQQTSQQFPQTQQIPPYYGIPSMGGVAEARVRELEERLRQTEEEHRRTLAKLEEEKNAVKKQFEEKENNFLKEKAAWEMLEKEVSQMNAQMMERLKLLREREQDHFTVLEDLARGFAHRVRNYLGIISGTIQLCVANYQMNEELKNQLLIVDQNVADMLKSIEEFLALARIPQMSPTKISLENLIEKILSQYQEKFNSCGIKLEKNFEQPEHQMELDEKLITDAISHLLDNAIESMPSGGTITLSTTTDKEKGTTILRISDTGSGISDTHLKKIFQPYFTTKKNHKGLGLTAAKRIADLHGATLTLESTKGKGTTITIAFLGKQ